MRTVVVGIACMLAAAGAADAASGGSAAPARLRIASAKCVPADQCQTNPRYVAPSGKLVLRGTGLARGQLVLFPRKSNKRRTISSKLRKSRLGLVVVVPPAAGSG